MPAMERERIIAMWVLHRHRRKKNRQRIHWVHPVNMKREQLGAFYTLFEDLREDQEKFFDYFSMSISSFDELHGKLKGTLQRQNTVMRDCIQPVEMLAVTIRYLASGCTFTDLHNYYRLGISTVSKIVRNVGLGIWSVMRLECLPVPTIEYWERTAANFENRANFPHCLGAVDGKLVRIIKGGACVGLMAVADSDYRFVYVEIGSYGKDCDSNIFKRSSLWTSIENNKLQLPIEKPLQGTASANVSYFLVGGEAFALHKHLLRPYGGSNLTLKKKVFNYRLGRARRCAECAFGILSNKWRIFHRPINLEPDFAVDIVRACVVLHNFVRDRDGYKFEDTTTIIGLDDVPGEPMVRGGATANNLRNTLADYFLTAVGSVSWQLLKI